MPLTSFFFVRVGAVDVGVDAGDKGIEFDVDGLPRFAAETLRLVFLVLWKFLAILDMILVNQKYLKTGMDGREVHNEYWQHVHVLGEVPAESLAEVDAEAHTALGFLSVFIPTFLPRFLPML